jgi:UDP-N-acetylglucosamine/UDP-N-acetylgalactosamine diphosphorylase
LSKIPLALQDRFVEHGQEHVLKFWDELDDSQQHKFTQQLEEIDFSLLNQIQHEQIEAKIVEVLPSEVVPYNHKYEELGIQRIQNGEFAVLTVAGGQGTRLGWSGPKGTYPATPVTGKSLFQIVAEQIVFASGKYGKTIPWYIMTSKENDEITRSFLLDNNCFGLDRTDIFIFVQDEIPAVDSEGKFLLATKNEVAMNPDGHGGVIASLKKSGGLEEMESRGIQYLSYVQIDNPLANVVDPTFLGIHVSEESSKEVTSKCVKKTDSSERVGVFCLVDGNVTVVEYSDLPEGQSSTTTEDGELLFNAGSTAIHIMSVEFLQRIADDLPWHVANKEISHIDLQTGNLVHPNKPNAYKYERFVFDILPLATSPLVVEIERIEEFAPIKNKEGNDSPQTSQQLQKDRARRWLQSIGVEVGKNTSVEISPLTAATANDLDKNKLPDSIGDDEIVVL